MKLKRNEIQLPSDVKHNRVDLTDRLTAAGISEPLGPAGKQYITDIYDQKHDEALSKSVLIRAREEDHRAIVKEFQRQQKLLKAKPTESKSEGDNEANLAAGKTSGKETTSGNVSSKDPSPPLAAEPSALIEDDQKKLVDATPVPPEPVGSEPPAVATEPLGAVGPKINDVLPTAPMTDKVVGAAGTNSNPGLPSPHYLPAPSIGTTGSTETDTVQPMLTDQPSLSANDLQKSDNHPSSPPEPMVIELAQGTP